MIGKFPILPASLLVLSLSARGADMYLELEDIKGESRAEECPDCIQVLSFSLAVNSEPSSGAGGAPGPGGRATFDPLVITKNLDAASPLLFKALANGEIIRSCTLRIFRTSGGDKVEFYTIKLFDAFIVDVSTDGAAMEDRFTERVSFLYRKIEWTYVTLGEDGKPMGEVKFTFDLEANKEA